MIGILSEAPEIHSAIRNVDVLAFEQEDEARPEENM
jgi:hypothetical protein